MNVYNRFTKCTRRVLRNERRQGVTMTTLPTMSQNLTVDGNHAHPHAAVCPYRADNDEHSREAGALTSLTLNVNILIIRKIVKHKLTKQ